MNTFMGRQLLTGSSLSSCLAQWTQPGFIKSIQRSTITITAVSNTATITAVDTSNAVLHFLGYTASAVLNMSNSFPILTFTNSTTITAAVNGNAAGNSVIVSFEVIEFFPGVLKSVQRGTFSGVTGGTSTITTVNTAKTQLDYLGMKTDQVGDSTELCRIALTNATTVTTTGISGGTHTVGWQVVEFY